MQRIVFTAWMGSNEMSEQRTQALLSITKNIACPHMHLTLDNLHHWIDPSIPIHPLFNLLSAVHRTDYIRCYMLHVHGGGYTDIKHTQKDWNPFFDLLEKSPAYGIGYTEVGEHGIAKVGGNLEQDMKKNYKKIIGVCSMIFRKRTKFTSEWFNQVNELIESRSDLLIKHPARHPQDQLGAHFTDGTISQYPFPWTSILGNLFHPLVYNNNTHILHTDMAPSFLNYR